MKYAYYTVRRQAYSYCIRRKFGKIDFAYVRHLAPALGQDDEPFLGQDDEHRHLAPT